VGLKSLLKEKTASFKRFLLPFPEDTRQHTLVRKLWRGISYLFLFFVFYIFAVQYNFLYLFGKTPGISQLENPKVPVASELYTADGKQIGKYFRENRTPVEYHEISPLLIDALLATEDTRFYEHSGIDPEATFSILFYLLKGDNRGGSTVTQQLAKNLFKTREGTSKGLLGYIPYVNTFIYKTKEWITAVNLERAFTKEEIITLYLNTVDFGSNSFGIKTAAKTFFNTSPDSLNIQQAAVLVGLLKAPTYYSPKSNPRNSLSRRNIVLSLLQSKGKISKTEFDSLKNLDLDLRYNTENHYDGAGTYFRGIVNNFLLEWGRKNGYDVYEDGLKIYTTIDSRLQDYAEESVAEQLTILQRRFYKHWEGKDPWVDENDNVIPGFLEGLIEKTDYYRDLKKKFNNNKDSIDAELNKPKRMEVFTWQGEKDTTFSTMDSLRYYKHFLHAGFMTMDPFTGYIRSWVGGINFKYFQYDHVKQSKRQPGSTFKPFVYATAFENEWSPCDKLPDIPVTLAYEEKG
jgi:penicillin-binding protein 1A